MNRQGNEVILSRHGFRAFTVLVAVGAFGWGIVMLLQAIDPHYQAAYLVPLLLAVAIEGFTSTSFLGAKKYQSDERTRFRIAEILFLMMVAAGIDALATRTAIADEITNPRLIGVAGVVALIWAQVLATARDFEDLDQVPLPELAVGAEGLPPLHHLANRFFAGSVLLMIVCGIAAYNNHNLALPLLVLILYVGAGLLLLGRSSFDSARFAWALQKLQPPAGMLHRWMYAAGILLFLALVLALLLPGRLLSDVGTAILAFLAANLRWPFLMQALNSGQLNRPTAPFVPPLPPVTAPPPASQGPGPQIPIIPILQAIAIIALVTYVVVAYLRDYPSIMAAVKRFSLFDLLAKLWRLLWYEARAIPDSFLRYMARRPRFRFRRGNSREDGYVHLSKQTSRDQVFYYYQSMLKRAADRGLPRRMAQTPNEYEKAVKPLLNTPEVDADLESLTGEFMVARYSRQVVQRDNVNRARQHYEKIRKALREFSARSK